MKKSTCVKNIKNKRDWSDTFDATAGEFKVCLQLILPVSAQTFHN